MGLTLILCLLLLISRFHFSGSDKAFVVWLNEYDSFPLILTIHMKMSDCRQFVAYGKSEICKACGFWSCKRRNCDRDDDCRNWDLPLDGS